MSKKHKHNKDFQRKDFQPETQFKSPTGTWQFINWLCSKQEILTGENAIIPLKDNKAFKEI